MGLFSKLKSSRTKMAASSVGTATLGGAQVTLTMVEKLMDGMSIPLVKGLAGIGVEIIKMGRIIHENHQSCDDLINRTASLLTVIGAMLNDEKEETIPDDLTRDITRLTSVFQDILSQLKVVEGRSKKPFVTATLYHYDNAQTLKECTTKLDWAMQVFQINSNLKLRINDAELRAPIHQMLDILTSSGRSVIGNERLWSYPASNLPPSPRLFGREEYLEDVVRLILTNESSRLAILGPGGIGKTSIALKIIHDERVVERFGERRYWVPCEQGTSLSLFTEILAKSLGLSPPASNDRQNDVFTTLRSSDRSQILLLDNFETPWSIEGHQSEVAHFLAHIASLSTVSILLTMRGEERPTPDRIDWTRPRLPSLKQLALAPAREAFLATCPDVAGDDQLDSLIEAIDCMPLAIILMARLAEEGARPSDLLSRWKSERTGLLTRAGGDRENSMEVSIKLSLESPSVKSDPDAIPLLSVISTLPGGVSLNRLTLICPSISGWKGALHILRRAALVYDSPENSFIHVLSPIRSYMLLHHPLNAGHRRDLQEGYCALAGNGLTDIDHPDYPNVMRELGLEQLNIESVLLDALRSSGDKDVVISGSIGFHNYLLRTCPRHQVISQAIQVARQTGSRMLGRCLTEYARLLLFQRNNVLAQSLLEEAKEQFTEYDDRNGVAHCLRYLSSTNMVDEEKATARLLLEQAKQEFIALGDRFSVARCLIELAFIDMDQALYDSSRSLVEEAIAEYNAVGGRTLIARSWAIIADTYLLQGDYDTSQSILERAVSEFKAFGHPLGESRCLLALARLNYLQDKYDLACTYQKDAYTLFTDVGELHGAAECLHIYGTILCERGQHEAAAEVLGKALAQFRVLGSSGFCAYCLQHLGFIQYIQGDYDKARSQIEEAKEIYTTLSDRSGVLECHLHLSGILTSEGQFSSAYSLLKQIRAEFKDIGDLSSSVDCLIRLSGLSFEEERYNAAITELEEAREECSSLNDETKMNIIELGLVCARIMLMDDEEEDIGVGGSEQVPLISEKDILADNGAERIHGSESEL